MKKIIAAVVFIIMVSILAAGCNGDGVKTYSDDGSTIKAKVDSEFIIALDSNPTTGYSWKAVYEESQFKQLSDEYKQTNTEEMIVGAGGIQYLRFKALKAGSYQITLNYQRSWEGEPLEQKVFNIIVS
jgi:inhibitor of cysteine peptidase